MRDELMKRYAHSVDFLKHRIREDQETNRLFCGITRFLFEDAIPDKLKAVLKIGLISLK